MVSSCILAAILFHSIAIAEPVELEEAGRFELEEVEIQSPRDAMLKSLLFPGWGQHGNGSELKAGLMAALEFAFMAGTSMLSLDLERELRLSREAGETADDLSSGNAPHYSRYSTIFDRRVDIYWIWGIFYFISVTDAYVDAKLSGFDREITEFPVITFIPWFDGNKSFTAGLRINF